MTQRGPTPATPRKKRTFEQEIAEDAEKEKGGHEFGASNLCPPQKYATFAVQSVLWSVPQGDDSLGILKI